MKMPRIDDLKIWVSPLTNEIYAGYLSKRGNAAIATTKVNVSSQVMATVMQRLDQEAGESKGMEYTSKAGTLTWRRKEKE
jgi:hypothetical protein